MFLLREVGAETLDLQVNRLALLSGEGGGGAEVACRSDIDACYVIFDRYGLPSLTCLFCSSLFIYSLPV
jgi:hypothetical protein